jgi:hypothetical protein
MSANSKAMIDDAIASVSKTQGKARHVNWVSLFTSTSTLICCALPALLVSIGAGAALSSLVSNVPQLIWISEHKPLVFGLAGAMLLIAGFMQWQVRNAPCPADPVLAATCAKARNNAFLVYCVSVLIYLVGAIFAFILPLLNSSGY